MATRLAIATKAPERVRLRCWGDFAIVDGATGADLRPRGRKARALLAYLAMHPDRPVSRERLTALLWGDRADEQARSSLRQSLYELRGLGNDFGLLAVDRDTVTLRSERLETDIERLRATAESRDYDTLLADLPEADEALFVNLDGLSAGLDEWLQIERTRQRDALITLIADASASAVALGRVRAARALHARLLELDPDQPPAAPVVHAPPPPPPEVAEAANRLRPSRRGLLAGLAVTGAALAVGGGLWLRVPATQETSREVRGLHDTARRIIYARRWSDFPIAEDLLRRAIALDPDYAPALASLASVTAMNRRTSEGMTEAERMARRAIALDPQLAQAHGVLGMVLNFETPEARAAIRQAAELDPRDPEVLFWLSNVHNIEGNYPARLDALRRAVTIDPLWHRASGTAALLAWEMGYPAEADRYAEQLRKHDLRKSFLCAYAVDWGRGDYSAVVRETVALRPQLQSVDAADWKLGNALLILGHVEPARLLLRLTPDYWEVARGGPASPAAFARINVEAEREERADFYIDTAVRQLMNAGRSREIAALFEARQGRIGSFADPKVASSTLVNGGANVALALRQSGREAEAAALLARIETAIRRSLTYGAVPNWFHAGAAQAWAVQGRHDDAIAMLTTAIRREWKYMPMTPLPDLAELPAFRPLHGDARFQALRAQLSDHLARERRELGPVPV